ncbi:bolA-like protein 1 isoform X2 [Rhinatrema bivittatum]|nr:bolA-like protein 1 isoform X2 [Rhinatrema bivittatum]XP_029436970.1 bolA-like protein 1 isoform X2 [Rhinatrema bivittatum]XP_029436971.1 bolA-like protein 1 isoform X2 [Rhinatrema bivittatum]XP_029436972.1 bolA-like protein 1 isoform X2 [Rhinatrema bivittatum]XP_029436973.1 bolA-like protein 1 isoform X2 [Rhinatrema bivittatum]
MLSSRLLWICRARLSPAFPYKHYCTGLPSMEKPIESSIRLKLTQSLQPVHLEVHNESHMHAVPKGSESHFKVVVISEKFNGMSLIQQHRLVNEALREELAGAVHALSILAKTPQQWKENPILNQSPPCLGGSKYDQQMINKLN